jgi:hypothetical protein
MIIDSLWRAFAAEFVPADMPDDARESAKTCFYAGTDALFAELTTTLGPGEQPTEADMATMGSIQQELTAFFGEDAPAPATPH